MDTTSRVEFAIKIDKPTCVEAVKKELSGIGIKIDDIETVIDSENKECRLVIKTKRPWIELQEKIESTGRRSVLVGFSDEAAVAMLDKGNDNNVKGVIRFCSITAGSPGIV